MTISKYNKIVENAIDVLKEESSEVSEEEMNDHQMNIIDYTAGDINDAYELGRNDGFAEGCAFALRLLTDKI